MLIQFSVTNYRSIRNEAVLSLVAGPGKEHRAGNVRTPAMRNGQRGTPLLRSAAIYGANAAGKTNLIRALAAMRHTVVNSSRDDAEIPVTPFRLHDNGENKPTQFEVECIADGVRYQYGFSASRAAVVSEWLFAWPHGRPQLWFSREFTEDGTPTFEFGGKLMGDREVWRRATRGNALFLSTAASLNSAQLTPLYDWFRHRLCVTTGGWEPEFSAARCVQGEHKNAVLDFLKEADFAIADLRVSKQEFSPEMIPEDVPTAMREEVSKELAGRTIVDVHLAHQVAEGKTVELDLSEESDGTQKAFALAGPWIDTLENGYVMVVDELHEHLHPMLVRHLVNRFHDPALESDAQLIFSTHDTSILSQDVFRRDQIWFCERNERQETELVPLSDYHPRKGLENLERGYLAGRYGAVPLIRFA